MSDTPRSREAWDEAHDEGGCHTGSLLETMMQLERELNAVTTRLRQLANAASILWEEHKDFSLGVHGEEGCDCQGSDSEGHALMEELVEDTLKRFRP